MHINIVLLAPPNYPHVAVFSEVIALYQARIQDLGYSVSRTTNRFKKDALNLVFGYNLLDHLPEPLLHFNYVICQLEQFGDKAGWNKSHAHFFHAVGLPLMHHARQVWDFSTENITLLQKFGIEARHLPLGFHPRLEQIQHADPKDVDVLFYGSTPPRRSAVLLELNKRCHVKTVPFGQYGTERDQWIGRSKIVLNIHAKDYLYIMEQSRISYLLTNRCFVLSEICNDNPYGDGLIQVPYNALIPTALEWLKKDDKRRHVIERGYDNIQKVDMRGRIQQALSALE
jgi:hypothetical protein